MFACLSQIKKSIVRSKIDCSMSDQGPNLSPTDRTEAGEGLSHAIIVLNGSDPTKN